MHKKLKWFGIKEIRILQASIFIIAVKIKNNLYRINVSKGLMLESIYLFGVYYCTIYYSELRLTLEMLWQFIIPFLLQLFACQQKLFFIFILKYYFQ